MTDVHSLPLIVLLVIGLVWSQGTTASVRVSVAEGCEDEVHVQVHDAELSQVLSTMTRELSFELSMAPEADERITLDASGSASEVISRLTRHASTTYMERSDTDCEGIQRPSRLWVHPSSEHDGHSDSERIRVRAQNDDPEAESAERNTSRVDLGRSDHERPRDRGRRRSMSPEERFVDHLERRERRERGESR